MMRHAPNLLSALRLVAAPFAAWLIVMERDTAALAVVAGCGLSDALDGAIARRWGFESDFGAWLDPAADKLLMLLCFLALHVVAAVPGWLVLIVIGRDGVIAGGWLVARLLSVGMQLRTSWLGKLSTALQILYIGLVVLLLAFDLDAPRLTLAATWITGAATLASGLAYAAPLLRGLAAGRHAH